MNRAIKFRVWDKQAQKFKKLPQEVVDSGRCAHRCMKMEQRDFLVYVLQSTENTIYQQSTGYLDKNKKEIFEGDIVCIDKENVWSKIFGSDQGEYTRGQVKWLGGGFSVCQSYIGATPIREFSTCDCCPAWLEVIGNIFESTHLII